MIFFGPVIILINLRLFPALLLPSKLLRKANHFFGWSWVDQNGCQGLTHVADCVAVTFGWTDCLWRYGSFLKLGDHPKSFISRFAIQFGGCAGANFADDTVHSERGLCGCYQWNAIFNIMLDGGPNGFEQAKDKAQDIETKALQVWTSDLNSQLVTCLHHSTFVYRQRHGCPCYWSSNPSHSIWK